MNVDFSRLLLKTGNGRPHQKVAGTDIILAGKYFGFSLVTGFNQKRFVVAQPRNPFQTHSPEQFEKLILDLHFRASNKKLVDDGNGGKKIIDINWMKELFSCYNVNGGSISRIIIDTNYHFATLFPMSAARISLKFRSIDIKIWFLWVYAQVEAIFPALEGVDDQNEASVVLETSDAIENTFSKSTFRHVISTIAMLPYHQVLLTLLIKKFFEVTLGKIWCIDVEYYK